MARNREHRFVNALTTYTGSANLTAVRVRGFTYATLFCTVISTISGSTPSLTARPQVSGEFTTEFADINVPPDITESITLAAQTTAGSEAVSFPLAALFLRAVLTLSGTSPSFPVSDVHVQLTATR